MCQQKLKKALQKLEQQIKLHELADDGYYLSRQYKEDYCKLHKLKTLLANSPAEKT